MKKLLALLLALAMVFSLAACGQAQAVTREAPAAAEEEATAEEPAPAETEEPAEPKPEPVGLPAVGDEVNGFVVKEIRDFPLVGGTAVLFEHEKTGAGLVYIANSDTNRMFDLTFFTRAIDNTGLPHVFEHSTLDGSEKYPSKALFFNLSYQTYATYMNAMTQALLTTYPVGSLSEAQLLKYADYYTDSCLHPMILNDESIFREEAWRYRLEDLDDPLTIEGTVYSEMLGALDLSFSSHMNALRTAYPGSTVGNQYGGDPAYIPDMTFESLRNYHELYYHPSNCVGYLYGSFDDYTVFLALLDEAFSPYEKREFSFEDPDYEPLTESVEKTFSYPVEAGSDTANATTVYYSFLCPGLKEDMEEETLMNTLTDLLTADASPLIQRLKAALPYGSFGAYIEIDAPDDSIVFLGQNLNPEDTGTFRDTVDAVLAELADTGFSDELVDGVNANLLMNLRLTPEESGYGVNVIASLATYHAAAGQPFGFLDYVEAMEEIVEWHKDGAYQKAIAKWLGEDAVTALAITNSEPGLREQMDAAEEARLAEVKASMSEEELQAIIDATLAEDEEDDASQYVAQLQAETASTLPEEIREFDYTDETGDDGVRRINVTADIDGVGEPILFLDASGLSQDDIHWFALYLTLLGDLDTAETDRETLAVRMTRWLYGADIRLSVAEDRENGGYIPRLRAGWIAPDEELAEGYDLMYEILFETDFSDAETVSGLISRAKATLKSTINAQAYSLMINRALGYYAPLYRYYSYFSGLEYYAFLEEAEALAASEPAAVAEKLQAVQEQLRNRTNAAAVYVGSEAGIAANEAPAAAFLAKLDERPVERVAYDLPVPAKNEALVVDTAVQFNGIVADYPTLGLENKSGEMDAVSALVNDAYLYPTLRDGYGAYGVIHGFVEDYGTYMVSYRDPNIDETFAAYEALPAFLKDLDLTQDDVDGYILSSYAGYAMPQGELSGGMDTALNVLVGDPVDLPLQYMRELKGLTPEVLAEYINAYTKLAEDGVRFTVGGAAAIAAEADRYDAVLNPFGASAAEADLHDVPEGSEHYEAVHFVLDNMMMKPLEDGSFGVDETASMGDFAGALYGAIGGDCSAQEEALGYLQGNGIFPAGAQVESELTGTSVNSILKTFSAALGVEASGDLAPDGSVMTRGMLAEVLMAYVKPLMA